MKFYLGAHVVAWLARVDVPLFVSRVRLQQLKKLPRARCRWALDSGGFSEVSTHGRWRCASGYSPADAKSYAAEVRRYRDEIGELDWAAPQDWMCEPFILEMTGLKMKAHRARTVANFCELRDHAPDLPIAPVLQGFMLDDYLRCIDAYDACGVDLWREPVVGVGSVCRRQGTDDAADIITGITLATGGLPLHGFGFKTLGLRRVGDMLASADSMAWSRRGREVKGAHPDGPQSCANCLHFALEWRERLLGGGA